MANTTTNLGLSITPEETNESFLSWRLQQDGPNNSNIQKLDKAWGDMKTMVDGAMAAVGHANTAATKAEMTDTSKVYVYVGSGTGADAGMVNGNWYYHDGSAWVSGGVYNAAAIETDTSLSIAGSAADAKTAGDAIRAADALLFTIEDGSAVGWEIGAVSSGTGESSDTTARIKMTGVLPPSVKYIYVSSGYKYIICAYSSTNVAKENYEGQWNGSDFAKSTGTWLTGRTYISNLGNHYFRVILSRDPDASGMDTSECGNFHMASAQDTNPNNLVFFDLKDVSDAWTLGGVGSSYGQTSTSTTRISTKETLPTGAKSISVSTGYRYLVTAYSSPNWKSSNNAYVEGNYVGCWNGSSYTTSGTWFDSSTVTDLSTLGNYYFRITLARDPDGGTMSLSEVSNISVPCELDSTMMARGVAADAKGVADYISGLETFVSRGVINDSNDLNDIVEPGMYAIGDNAIPQNAPNIYPGSDTAVTGRNAHLLVFKYHNDAYHQAGITQIYIAYALTSGTGPIVFVRFRRSTSSWYAWAPISLTSIAQGADNADDIVKPGTYLCVTSSGFPKNLPVNVGGILICTAAYGTGQTIQTYTTPDTTWWRFKSQDGWNGWVKSSGITTSYPGIPELKFTCDKAVFDTMTKDNAVTVKYDFFGQTGPAVVKWQGSSSTRYAKKNYTIKLDDATDYAATATYAVGDYAKYNGTVYICNTEISTPEAWTAAHWDAVTNSSSLRTAAAFNAASTYAVGDQVYRVSTDKYYECIVAITTAHAFNSTEWKEVFPNDFDPARNTTIPAYNTASKYAVGAYVKYDRYMYRCTTAINTPEAWTAAHWTKVTGKGLDAWLLDRYFMNNFYDSISTGTISMISTDSRWGMQTKFCAKADYIDPSHLRNVVCARLWGEVVASRGTRLGSGHAAPAAMLAAPNYGAINGFPITISLNGVPMGLYSFNIPKDEWLFAMDTSDTSKTQYAAGGEDNSSQACQWKAPMDLSGDLPGDFEVEVRTSNKTDLQALTSLNNAITAVASAGSGWDSDSNVTSKIDVDSVFDYFIFTLCINNNDALARNILYSSYDGTKWHMNAYDLDTTFGFNPYGNMLFSVSANGAGERCNFAKAAAMNQLAYLMKNYSVATLKARYKQLREGILSDEHVFEKLTELGLFITDAAYRGDHDLWREQPSTGVVSIPQYMEFYHEHCKYLDEEIDNMLVAESAIQNGAYFSIGNRLFLATKAIASGASVIPGTSESANCTEVSLTDALNQINT